MSAVPQAFEDVPGQILTPPGEAALPPGGLAAAPSTRRGRRSTSTASAGTDTRPAPHVSARSCSRGTIPSREPRRAVCPHSSQTHSSLPGPPCPPKRPSLHRTYGFASFPSSLRLLVQPRRPLEMRKAPLLWARNRSLPQPPARASRSSAGSRAPPSWVRRISSSLVCGDPEPSCEAALRGDRKIKHQGVFRVGLPHRGKAGRSSLAAVRSFSTAGPCPCHRAQSKPEPAALVALPPLLAAAPARWARWGRLEDAEGRTRLRAEPGIALRRQVLGSAEPAAGGRFDSRARA